MYNQKTKSLVYFSTLFFMVIFSFFNFSEQYYPFFNSEMAINVLMTHGFSIPGDFYLWGQNHEGALIPLISQLLFILFLFPPVLAVSFIHFSILIAGYAALASLLKDHSLKLALALVWFFPSWHFHDHLVMVNGIQMSFIAIAVYFLNRNAGVFLLKQKLVWLSLACISYLVSIWVYDSSVFFLPAFILGVIWSDQASLSKPGSRSSLQNRSNLIQALVILFWLTIGTAIILFLKSRAVVAVPHHQYFIAGFSQIAGNYFRPLSPLLKILLFASGNPAESVHFWFILIGVPVIFLLTNKRIEPGKRFYRQRWLLFFLISGLFALLLSGIFSQSSETLFSYSVLPLFWLSCWTSFLLFLQSNGSTRRTLRLALLYSSILAGSLSSFMPFYLPQRVAPRMAEASKLKTLGDIGIISTYPLAYIISAQDPRHIKATPNDKNLVLSPYLASEVFKQPSIFLISNGWLTSFPDTVTQFGHLLVKSGNTLTLAGYNLCRYADQILHEEFCWNQMKYQGTAMKDESATNGQSVTTTHDIDATKHFVFGPFISLSPGKILVSFRLKTSENLNSSKLAYLDVSADFGKVILASRTIQFSEFERPGAYQEFAIPVEIGKRYDGIEFRVLFLGNGDLTFDKVTVQGI
jgi:hypothetical protein